MSQGKILVKKIPLIKDSFSLHLLLAFSHLTTWKQENKSFQQLSGGVRYGYEMDVNKKLQPKLMNQGVSAPELLNELICACTNNMTNAKCICLRNDQPYSPAGKCMATLPFGDEVRTKAWCTNPFTISALDKHSDTDESDNAEIHPMTFSDMLIALI